MGFSFVVIAVRKYQAWGRYTTHWLKVFGFFKEYNRNHYYFKEKRPYQRCLVNAFVWLVVIMNIAYIKCISSLLS